MHEQSSMWSRVARERHQVIGNFHLPMWRSMIDTVGAKAGVHVLDAGCGSGGASELCLQRGATVTGVDLSSEMIGLCRESLGGATFEVGSLEELPFATATFDAVIACMVVHFCPNPLRALQELARVTKPGGRIAISSPARPDDDIFLALHVAAELRPDDTADIMRPLMFAQPGRLASELETLGLHDITETIVDLQVGPTSFDAAWRLVKSFGPVAITIERAGEQQFLDSYVTKIRHCFSGETVTMSANYRVTSAVR
jgi:SAM-dependent methyltransferase